MWVRVQAFTYSTAPSQWHGHPAFRLEIPDAETAPLPTPAQAGDTRCFLEELPQDTIVVGHYKAEEWEADSNKWGINDRLGIQITVEVRVPPSGCCPA